MGIELWVCMSGHPGRNRLLESPHVTVSLKYLSDWWSQCISQENTELLCDGEVHFLGAGSGGTCRCCLLPAQETELWHTAAQRAGASVQDSVSLQIRSLLLDFDTGVS